MVAPHTYALEPIIAGVQGGDRRSIARALRIVDDVPELAAQLLSALHAHRRGATVLGITGHPGAGKSTLVDKLVEGFRAQGKRVGVLAVDPSSPFSGGAILGDRIRMVRHHADDGVFIRSLATRGALGGLSHSTFAAVRVLDAAGFDMLLIETVGVGQDEVDVVRLADTTLVVLVPGLGDDIQAIKAGLLEIGDVLVINKADRDGVHDLERGLKSMLSHVAADAGAWEPPIVRTVAPRGEGVAELLAKVAAHQAHLQGAAGQHKRHTREREFFSRLLDMALVQWGRARLPVDQYTQRAHEADPYALVQELVGRLPQSSSPT